MSRLKKILIGIAATLAILVAAFLIVVGPWPVYRDSKFETSKYYQKALADIDASVAKSHATAKPDHLRAGWGMRIITPKAGTPLAGYGDRKGAPSTGVRDELHVKAIALNDGQDTIVLVGSDMLLVPPNVAELVREKVAAETPITADGILFTASHTHCGPGAWAPGIAGNITGGKFDPSIPTFLADAFAGAIIEAYGRLEPAKLAHGSADGSQFIRNRTREAAVDSNLDFMLIEQEDGDKCYVTRFSAHPTNFGGDMRDFSAEYPGELQRYLERDPKTTAIYLGGSLGSSGPRAPEAPSRSARVEAMGIALANLVLENTPNLEFQTNLDIVALGVPLGMPSAQMRPVWPSFRISPILGKLFGIPPDGWMQGIRIGDLMMIGMPFDFSGETSLAWREWLAPKGFDLWTTGFCAAYLGYLSPDKYYNLVEENGMLDYETGLMGWFGPNTEAYMTALFHHAVEVMTPPQQQAALTQ